MTLVNETQQQVVYLITCAGMSHTGTLNVNDLAELPAYDNQTDVTVEFRPVDEESFRITVNDTHAGEQVEMALVVG
jgi:hypothetical protein